MAGGKKRPATLPQVLKAVRSAPPKAAGRKKARVTGTTPNFRR